ncbi:conserved hypothetical protein [Vibrio nigripulchritudo SOn1]|uniref:Fe2OG dioxygenase domain-containing protein n=1 Tax=Vibrio nigripulchritudo SOn1 TaxID=1238450 RepID=A0AAV2VYS0_9VIBR|nr:hypothetical protein [Vibrio nigripulchritudo]CCO49773.1 conserved hypothetical protein [Vibrio nigripulchritudo SOn1]
MDLNQKLIDFEKSLSPGELANFKLLLGISAGGLSPNIYDKETTPEFDFVAKYISETQPYSYKKDKTGIAWVGRPEFMTDELLKSLTDESKVKRTTAIDYTDHYLGCGGVIADKLSISNELVDFIKIHVGDIKPTGIASYIYYDKEGQGISPHIDTDVFSLNVLIMLEHIVVNDTPSNLVMFPYEAEPIKVKLTPGDMIIMFSGSTAHGRELLANGEKVSILTLGFHPLG